MLLVLIRHTSNAKETRGSLAIDGVPYCDTIEPPMGWGTDPSNSPKGEGQFNQLPPSGGQRGSKGAIPRGWYRVDVTYSGKFKRPMPILRMVPGFEGIRIHAGLSVKNTSGCICVGYRSVEEKLTQLLIKAQENGEEIFINVTDSDRYDAEHSRM